jgi:hypothetical protein
MLFRCVAAIPNSDGHCVEHFYPDTPEGHTTAEAFVKEYNRQGWGVYNCVSPLKSAKRTKDNVAQIVGLHADLDVYKSGAPKEEVIEKLRDTLTPFGILSLINSSGRGLQAYLLFREPIEAGTPDAERAQLILKRLIAHLGADPQPSHFAALMRRVGTMNSKEGGGPCETLLDTGARCELSDIEAYLDLVEDRGGLFPANEPREEDEESGPVNVEEALAAMKAGDKQYSVNRTQTKIIPSLIWHGWHPENIVGFVVERTMQMAERDKLSWSKPVEEECVRKRVLSAYQNLFLKEYDHTRGDIPVWLAMEFHEAWASALAAGRRPVISRNGAGWHVRGYVVGASPAIDGSVVEGNVVRLVRPEEREKEEAQQEQARQPPKPFVLRPFKSFDAAKLPQRDFLFGTHYQRRTVSGTVAPGGTGKSSLVLVECIAMSTARNLLGEKAEQRLRVWYHNGEDNIPELQRRVAGVCQHYEIPMEELEGWFFMTSGTEVPLRVAESWNQVRLNTDHRLVKYITEAIGDNKIDVAALDPLVTLHGVRESDPGQMDSVVRIFARIADTQNCGIDLSHHTRKLLPGASIDEYTIDDMRGAKAISDAMRTVRLLNFMSAKDAEDAGLMEIERTGYFRIDRGKANYSAPSKKATWRRFETVDLANGDSIGVVVPWEHPGQDGQPSAKKMEADRVGGNIPRNSSPLHVGRALRRRTGHQ